MIPIGTDIPQRRIPWMNILLIASNVVIYFLSHSIDPRHPTTTGLAPGWDNYILYPGPRCALIQFISYQFLHASLMHLLGNMVFLYVFGNNLNEKLGHVGYLAFYLAGGVFAGCGQILTSPSPTLGASGSISAVTGLYFVLLPSTHIRILFYYFSVIEIPSMWFIAFCFAKDLAEPFFLGDNSVAHFAHLAGTVTGFVVGLVLLWTRLVQRDHYDLGALINRWRRRREYLAVVSQGYDPFGRTPSAPPPRMNAHHQPSQVDSRIEFLRDTVSSLARQKDLPQAAAKYLELIAIDPGQVMSADLQIDLATQLYSNGNLPAASAAYELYLKYYAAHPSSDQIRLLLGVLYTHAYPNAPRARELLTTVLPRLRNPAEQKLAEDDLAYLNQQFPASPLTH